MRKVGMSEMKLGLRIHAIVFAPSMVLLLIINLFTGAPYWVLWVALGWGSGLLAHWLAVWRHAVREVRTT